MPPALTNLMDHFPPSLFYHRPSAIVSYSVGGQGGIAANMALRGFLCEFGQFPYRRMCADLYMNEEMNE